MKVALVHSFYRSGPSGEDTVVRAQAEALSKAGHDVKLIARETNQLISTLGYALRAGLQVASGYGPSPLAALEDFSPDVVHVHNLFPNWSRRWIRKVRVPLVVQLHNFRSLCAAGTMQREGSFCDLCPRVGSLNAVRHRCYRNSMIQTIPLAVATRNPKHNPEMLTADRIIVLDGLRPDLERYLPASITAKFESIPNFIQDEPFEKDEPGRSVRSRWLYVGRLAPEKGVLELVRHWPHGEKLDIIGDGPLLSEIEASITEKEISVLGNLPREQVMSQMAQAEGLVFPSLWREGEPLVYIEALSRGLPVLAMKGSMVAEDVLESESGVVLQDLSGLVSGMEEIRNRKKILQKRARERFVARYSESAWVSAITEVYNEVRSEVGARLARGDGR